MINDRLNNNYDKFSFGLIVDVKMQYVPIAVVESVVHGFAVVPLLRVVF
jgi:hypothetical protein